ncbi:MAG: DUF1284 domain-containing protein [Candidatus Sericytochromatia bacterium]|nr:DUF1284 domain-containing protein [Candidatus Sericytochromatia bacterium]
MTGPSKPVKAPLALRGHHFLCTLHYQGAGYSSDFVANFTHLMETVASSERTEVVVAAEADAICGPCPSLQPDGQTCAHQVSISRRDRALLEAMGWSPGDRLDLEQAHRAVLARREELMEKVCPGCEWLPRCLEKGPNGIASPLRRGPSPSGGTL